MSFLALAKVQFELSGGWRQNAIILAVYVALVLAVSGFVYGYAGASHHDEVSATFLTIMSIIQGALVLLVAPSAVRRAVLRDFQTAMIESHRLTPLSSLSLVLGYLTGPAAQVMLLYGAGLVVGGYFAADYGQSLGFPGVIITGWYASQLSVLTLALLVAALVLLTALATRGKTNLMLPLILLGVFGGYWLVLLVPGLALLMGVMSGGLIISVLTRSAATALDPAMLGWAMVLQVAMALVLLIACCRKVRAPDRPAFSLGSGLLLLLVSGFTLVMGVRYFEGFRRLIDWDESWLWQWGGSTLAFVLVGLIPLAAAASQRQHRDRAAVLATRQRPPILRLLDLTPLLLAALTAALMVLLLLEVETVRLSWSLLTEPTPVAALSVAFFLTFWTDYVLVYTARTWQRSAKFALLFTWFILRIVPVAADAAAALSSFLTGEPAMAVVWRAAGISPIGSLLILVRGGNPWPGIAIQGIIAAVATLIGWFALDRAAARATMATRPASPPSTPPP